MQPTINYNHLYYFWVVARLGSIAAACDELMLAPPTVSTQLKTLETNLGQRLFERQGRGMVLTQTGRLVFRHADEMFRTASDLMETLRGRPPGRPMRLTLGIADAMPKTVAYRLVRPVMTGPEAVSLVCHEGKPAQMLAELALHELDAVLTDSPLVPEVRVKAFTHLLGECGVTLLGSPELADRYRPGFPDSLHHAPLLLPTSTSALRRMLDAWFQTRGLRPEIRGEIADSALIKVFGQSGEGLFFVPSVVEAEVCSQYGVERVGRIDELRERFFAVTIERTIHHPAVIALCDAARRTFGETQSLPDPEHGS
jgi:LysR family transcriptional activator of nhaA